MTRMPSVPAQSKPFVLANASQLMCLVIGSIPDREFAVAESLVSEYGLQL